MLPLPKHIGGLSEVFGLYDGFILDLWGVVHDGTAPFPDTIPALEFLKKAKRKVWLLSNAPRRIRVVIEKLSEMGISPEIYDGILTSGEASWQALRDTYLEKWGRRCFHIGRPNDVSLFEELDIERVKNPADADFVLNSGVVDLSDSAEKYIPLLEECAGKSLPMLCANPDKIVHIGDQLVICAGMLADMYERMDDGGAKAPGFCSAAGRGGEIVRIGKPHRGVYSHCLKEMGGGRVLAVGDSMVTDIQGATGSGLDSVLVLSGIHREEIGDGITEDFLEKYPYRPDYVMPCFSW